MSGITQSHRAVVREPGRRSSCFVPLTVVVLLGILVNRQVPHARTAASSSPGCTARISLLAAGLPGGPRDHRDRRQVRDHPADRRGRPVHVQAICRSRWDSAPWPST